MSVYYFDTDAFVKILVPEVGHDICEGIYLNKANIIILNEWTILETHSALNRCKNNQEITPRLYHESIARFNEIVTTEDIGTVARIRVESVTPEHIRKAVTLVDSQGSLFPGDALQVAIALKFKALDVKMVTGDKRVIRAANKNGLETINANNCICKACGHEINFTYLKTICDICGAYQSVIDEAKCSICGAVCAECANPKWCERIKKVLAS